jgi:hypothetical protein
MRAIVAFTGHSFVMTDRVITPIQSDDVPPPDGYGGSLDPRYVVWLAGRSASIGTLDALFVKRGTGSYGAPSSLELTTIWDDHYRVRHAREIRSNVRVFADERGFVTLADGLVGRREIGVEAVPNGQGRGWGRSLIVDALALVEKGEPLFAAISPGNARSLRAFVALGFVAIASEQQWFE